MTTNRLSAVLIALLIIAALAAVVLVAIGSGSLWSLIGGVFAVGVIGVALAIVGVELYSRVIKSRAEREKLLYDHIEAMAGQGIMVNPHQVLSYTPLPQLVGADDNDIPIDTTGITNSSVDQYFGDAYNLAALSAQWQRSQHVSNPKQLAPYRVAKKSDYFCGGDGFLKWQHGMAYFCIKMLAEQTKIGGKSKGTFLRGSTPEQVFATMKASPHPASLDAPA